mmetsp:Transcript_10868/g.1641  ORF Transcript_10868/g.1641 Transcript_10868/m.1641 type:complete len:153 (+) Transcript_10868:1521-1979(+)
MLIDRPDMRVEMGPIEQQSKLEIYESPIDDYMEMALQYGYLVLFCAAFPLTPLFALIEIVIEIKVDAWKLCKLTKRPRPYRAENNGVWRMIMLTISYIAAFSNAAIIMFASPAFIELGNYEKLILFFALEHSLMFLKYAISVAIPDEPVIVK